MLKYEIVGVDEGERLFQASIDNYVRDEPRRLEEKRKLRRMERERRKVKQVLPPHPGPEESRVELIENEAYMGD